MLRKPSAQPTAQMSQVERRPHALEPGSLYPTYALAVGGGGGSAPTAPKGTRSRSPKPCRAYVEWQPNLPGHAAARHDGGDDATPSPTSSMATTSPLGAVFQSTASGPSSRRLARMQPASLFRAGTRGAATTTAAPSHPIPCPPLQQPDPCSTPSLMRCPPLHPREPVTLGRTPYLVAGGDANASGIPLLDPARRPTITFAPVGLGNVNRLRRFNAALFPVVYSDSFYSDLCHVHPKGLSTLAIAEDGAVVGAICCRKEAVSPHPDVCTWDVYIMTLGVLAPYRRMKLGTTMLHRILAYCSADPSLQFVCLHVHTSNTTALSFYQAHGFQVHARVPNYYAKDAVDPPDAFLLRRLLLHSGA